MKLHLTTAILLMFSTAFNANAQFTNTGVPVFVGQEVLLKVDDNMIHNDGSLILHGKLEVTGNFNYSGVSQLFDSRSGGDVILYAANKKFYGNGIGVFPNLSFRGSSRYTFESKAEITGLLDIDNAELMLTQPEALTLKNVDPYALQQNKGFINTSNGVGSSFVRYLSNTDKYIFPLGSSKLKIVRFVTVKPKDNNLNAVAVSFIDRDPTFDGYNSQSRLKDIDVVNDNYYHTVKRVSGNTALDVSFFLSKSEAYSDLATWSKNATWHKVNATEHPDVSYDIVGLSKAINYQSAQLDLGVAKPFTFAQATTYEDLKFFNAFSPDGDGKNDTWEVKNIDQYPDNNLMIFDRSGNVVFKTNNYSSSKYWDGKNAASGTYLYILNVKVGGVSKSYKGAITMIKK